MGVLHCDKLYFYLTLIKLLPDALFTYVDNIKESISVIFVLSKKPLALISYILREIIYPNIKKNRSKIACSFHKRIVWKIKVYNEDDFTLQHIKNTKVILNIQIKSVCTERCNTIRSKKKMKMYLYKNGNLFLILRFNILLFTFSKRNVGAFAL